MSTIDDSLAMGLTPTDVTSSEVKTENSVYNKLSHAQLWQAVASQIKQDLDDMKIVQQKSDEASLANAVSKTLAGATTSEDLLQRITSLQAMGIDPQGNLGNLEKKVKDNLQKYQDLMNQAQDLVDKADGLRAKRKSQHWLTGLTLGLNAAGKGLAIHLCDTNAASLIGEANNALIEGNQRTDASKSSLTSGLDKVGSKLDELQKQVSAKLEEATSASPISFQI